MPDCGDGLLQIPADYPLIEISVIVPCYNQERYLARCLASLQNQTLSRDRYEVILVDNLSEDGSAAIARTDPGVIIVEESKRGSYAARNAGARIAKGNILAFTDSDCEVAPTWLEQILQAMSSQSTMLILGSQRFATETLPLATLADYEFEKAELVFNGHEKELYYAYTNNMAVKRQLYLRCGPFLEIDRGADTVFMSRTLEFSSCQAVQFIPEMSVRHLEIDRWHSWPRKMWTYGRSNVRCRHVSHTRPLSLRHRWIAVRQTIRRHRYSVASIALLLCCSVAAAAAYEAGRALTKRRPI
jgi:glycosyltransferase involved in cell wall biosynthesis